MKYSIQSSKPLKRMRWFINKEFGISINYRWEGQTSKVTFDTSLIEEGCQDDWIDLVNAIKEAKTEEEKENLEIEIDYPAPWYFADRDNAAIWTMPKSDKTISPNFGIIIQANYVFGKATELQNDKKRNHWSSTDGVFMWEKVGERPSSSQICTEFEEIAKVFNSGAWQSENDLDKLMHEEFGMVIEDDVVTFVSPSISQD